MTTQSEAEIQHNIREYLTRIGHLVIRINQGRKGNVPFSFWQVLGDAIHSAGISDLLTLGPDGRLYAIETKIPGEKPTPQQTLFLTECYKRGAVCIVADSLESLITQMEKLS